MIANHHERGNLWLRLKMFFTLSQQVQQQPTVKTIAPKPKRRSHRTTAFFELP